MLKPWGQQSKPNSDNNGDPDSNKHQMRETDRGTSCLHIICLYLRTKDKEEWRVWPKSQDLRQRHGNHSGHRLKTTKRISQRLRICTMPLYFSKVGVQAMAQRLRLSHVIKLWWPPLPWTWKSSEFEWIRQCSDELMRRPLKLFGEREVVIEDSKKIQFGCRDNAL